MNASEFADKIKNIVAHLECAAEDVEEDASAARLHAGVGLAQLRELMEEAKTL